MKKSAQTIRKQRNKKAAVIASCLAAAALAAIPLSKLLLKDKESIPEETTIVSVSESSTLPSSAVTETEKETALISETSAESTTEGTSSENSVTEATTLAIDDETLPLYDKTYEEISSFKAGTVIASKKIDKKNLDKYFTAVKIKKGDDVYKRIIGRSYKENKDIKLSDLRYLKMLHVNFDGKYQVGEMIVNKSVADQVMDIFKSLCKSKYQIYSMYLIDDFWKGNGDASDYASIDANNTSSFCYRKATGSSKISKHALGKAIDINPQQNPYVTYRNGKAKYSHSNASDFVYNRSSNKPHVITRSDKAYKLFIAKGWVWGGSWNSPKDYQHFQFNK